MTSWTPDLSKHPGPRYSAIADALERDVSAGRISAGERLPTHRALAAKLGVTTGTVTRAYAEAERRRLVTATVGRGTFVRGAEPLSSRPSSRRGAELIDLRSNYPANGMADDIFAETLGRISRESDVGDLLQYQDHRGMPAHRAAGAAWIGRFGLNISPERVLVTAGAQHALAVALATVMRPGDLLLTESLTYHNSIRLAKLLRLKLHGLAMDEEGLLPDAFEEACKTLAPSALYCTPSFQNPTAGVMGADRRRVIANIAATHGVTIIEDDVYGFLAPEVAPLTSHAQGQFCYIASTSKSMAPGLRIGYLVVPEGEAGRFSVAIRSTTWMATPLTAEIVTRWVEDGTSDRLARQIRQEAEARQAIAREKLAGLDLRGHRASFHLWLALTEPWRGTVLANRARDAGVAVLPADVFAVAPNPPEAVRICLGAAMTRADLARGTEILARLLRDPPAVEENDLSIV